MLRDYQEWGVEQVFSYFQHQSGNPLLLYPTATGKSWIVAGICTKALDAFPATRILMLTKTRELVDQNYQKLKIAWPEAPVGIFCDGLGFKQLEFPITFGTIASVYKIGEKFGFIDFVVIDEAHEISPKDETMYRKLFKTLQIKNPAIKFIGLTATGYRMKQGKLTDGDNALFTDVIVDCTGLDAYNWFFEQGYLVPPVPRPTNTEYDISHIKITGGDYDEHQMQELFDNEKKNLKAVEEMLLHASDRHCCLVFTSGVDHASHICDILQYYGQSATWVASRGMSGDERDRRILEYRNGEHKWIVTNGLLTTGFDHPPIDFMGMVRLTLSTGLWQQMLGRGTRPLYAPGFELGTQVGRQLAISASSKQNCLVLDFGQNVTRLGPINDPRVPLPRERKRAGDAPIRICDQCGVYNHASARKCWYCGYIFPVYLKIGSSSTEALVRKRGQLVLPEVGTRQVDRVLYMTWRKPGKPDSMKVIYYCGPNMYSEWVCMEHGGYPTHKAHEWWRERTNIPPPSTTADALSFKEELKKPRFIKVVVNQPNGEITGYEF
jgi:DNA repair protein RadD